MRKIGRTTLRPPISYSKPSHALDVSAVRRVRKSLFKFESLKVVLEILLFAILLFLRHDQNNACICNYPVVKYFPAEI